MALNISTDANFVGRHTAPDANYLYGSSKDETSPGAGDGSPYILKRANDIFGFQQALLKSSGIVPNGSAETQLISEYLQSIVELASGRAFNYDDSGVANAYVLDAQTDQQTIQSLFDGLIAEFIVSNSNTTASTVNVAGTGVKNIVNTAAANTLTAGNRIKLRYRLGTDDWEIIAKPTVFSESFVSAEQTITSAGLLTIAHGLSVAPTLIQARLICKIAEHNYSINDEIIISPDAADSTSSRGLSIVPDSTNLNIRYGVSATVFAQFNKTTGAVTALTNGSWRLILRAWA